MSKTTAEKHKKTRKGTAPKSYWRRAPVQIAISVVLAAAMLAALILLLNSCEEEDNTKPGSGKVNPGNSSGTAAPVTENLTISNVLIYDVGVTSISASWSTNIPATTELHATVASSGTTFASYPDKNLRLGHSATVYALVPATAYRLKVVSANASGKKAEVIVDKPYTTLAKRTTVGISAGDPCPDFSLMSITGKTVSMSDFAGKRTLIVIWAFRYDRELLPYINTFYNDLAGDIKLVTIGAGAEAEPVKQYMQANKLDFPVLLDPDLKIENKFALAYYPTSFLIDSSGKVAKIKEGPFISADDISAFVK